MSPEPVTCNNYKTFAFLLTRDAQRSVPARPGVAGAPSRSLNGPGTMAKRTKASTAVIQNLLEEKRQIERWLRRLDMAGDKTPAGVRDKVRADYGTRRDAILDELQGHRDALTGALKGHRANRDQLAAQEDDATERLSEAELRHAVGEYDADKWTEIRASISEELVGVREELEAAQAEITQLEEVLDAIERPDAAPAADEAVPPAKRAPAAKAAPPPPPEPEPVEEEAEEDAAEDEPEPEPAVAELEVEEQEPEEPKAQPAAAANTDELAFLKSVISSDQTAGSLKGKAGTAAAEKEEEPRRPAPRGSSKKTVKCTDCGTLNLPTEWYCEMCGAELTAL